MDRNTSISRRRFLAGTAAAATLGLAGLTTGCKRSRGTGSGGAASRPPLKVGYLPILDAAPLLIAHAKGFYAAEGLAMQRPTLMRNWAALSEAFMAERVDLAHFLSPLPIFMRFGRGFPVKVVAFDHLNGSAITVKDTSGIKEIKDLAGRQIAVPHWYSVHNVLLQFALRGSGIEPVIQDRDKPLAADQANLFLMMPPDMPTALSKGAIDAYIVAEPFNAAGETLAGGRVLRFTGDIWKDHACCQAVLHASAIDADREWAQKVVNAVVAAELWTLENREEAAHILSKDGDGYLPMPESIVARAMNAYDLATYGPGGTGAIRHPEWKTERISFNPQMYESYTRKLVELLKLTKVEGDAAFLATLDPDKVIAELFDDELLASAVAKVGGLAKFADAGETLGSERVEILEV